MDITTWAVYQQLLTALSATPAGVKAIKGGQTADQYTQIVVASTLATILKQVTAQGAIQAANATATQTAKAAFTATQATILPQPATMPPSPATPAPAQ